MAELFDTQQSAALEMRPVFYIGQHDSSRTETLTDLQYGQVLNAGFSFVTTPITNAHFRQRIEEITARRMPDPIVTPLTPDDTTLYPSSSTGGLVAYSSPWIDLCSPDALVASISRQVLNLEVSYANFCGIRSLMVAGPRTDAVKTCNGRGIAQYARAVMEAIAIGGRMNLVVHLPMYREPGLDETCGPLSDLVAGKDGDGDGDGGGGGGGGGGDGDGGLAQETDQNNQEIDLFSAWDSWNVIRSMCKYDVRLFVALKLPRTLPEKGLQTRWFSEPLQYLTLTPQTFVRNKEGHPALRKRHQDLIKGYMTLKQAPYFILCDLGPQIVADPRKLPGIDEFPTLAEAADKPTEKAGTPTKLNEYAQYLRYIEASQQPMSAQEQSTLTNFQDWLQSPLQPLSDNLESVTYEVFEGDPVKYAKYEQAITQALADWSQQGKPTSSPTGAVVIAVAGSGRGPLVTRALRASETTGVPVLLYAVEKNPSAYVYLVRENEREWNGRVTVVKTDMRAWKGPLISASTDGQPVHGKVDILISELLGSFGDNELSPECLDGIQHVLSTPHGISIPQSYTAHLTPICTPRIHADIRARHLSDPTAFETPWVVRLFQLDFVAQCVWDHGRFQQAWEFAHPLPQHTMDRIEARRSGGVVGGGGGSMAGGVGANDHNTRHCHLTFVCRDRGLVHGLAGYFESVLYASPTEGVERVELSTLPEEIERKSKDMISWFPIFFPLREPLYFPADTELEVSMWRQTDDTKVWYEWMVEAYTWTGLTSRIRVNTSELCSSRKVACLM